LAMNNARLGSDIDLIIITKKGTLWTTRFVTHCLLLAAGFKLRRAGDRHERDRICMNMWMDERDLKLRVSKIKLKNLFISHELLQVRPLVNKNQIYEKLLTRNKWIFDYWSNAVMLRDSAVYKGTKNLISQCLNITISIFIEPIAYRVQKYHMRNKITREVVTPTRAFFHPVDWGEKVVKKLD
jgi:hypothetical protein